MDRNKIYPKDKIQISPKMLFWSQEKGPKLANEELAKENSAKGGKIKEGFIFCKNIYQVLPGLEL